MITYTHVLMPLPCRTGNQGRRLVFQFYIPGEQQDGDDDLALISHLEVKVTRLKVEVV